jgi:hypothetical protein
LQLPDRTSPSGFRKLDTLGNSIRSEIRNSIHCCIELHSDLK